MRTLIMRKRQTRAIALGTAAVIVSISGFAQKLPAPARTVYKCEVAGQVSYSDQPCLGAKTLEVEPTRGLNASSGRVRIGPDVQREHQREAFAEAVRPLTGMDAKQFDREGRRMKLTPAARQQCRQLDSSIPNAEQEERRSSGKKLAEAQSRLFSMRKRFRELQC
jgi:hypothetical protein